MANKNMSPLARKLYKLASRPLTFKNCVAADRIVDSIEDRAKRHRAADFVQSRMWDRLPESKVPRTSRGRR